jgi:hypothetical protein
MVTRIKWALFIFLLLRSFSTAFGQHQLEFHPTYGNRHHTGTADLSIENAIYYLENNQLWFEFFIKDDQVMLNNGDLNSDHLEFWFTVNEKSDVLFSMNTSEEYTGWYYYHLEDKPATTASLHDQFRNDYIGFESWQHGEVDSAFYTADVKTKKEFTGTVHWGVYPDTLIMHDIKFYDYLPDQLVAPTADKAVYEIKDGGYSVKVHFTPEQLLFLNESTVRFQKLNVVVFDQDESGKSLHTLTKNYRWGEVDGFPSLQLDPPLTINVSDTYTDFESSSGLFHLYFFEGDNWKIIAPSDDRIRFYQPYYSITWNVQNVNREEIFIGEQQLYFYDEPRLLFFPQSNHWIDTDYELEQVKNIRTIEFKDGSIAFYNTISYMQNAYGHGPCGGCDHEQTDIYLLNEKGPQLILSADINMGNMQCIWREHDIEITEEWIPEFDKQSWNMELEELTVPALNDRDYTATNKNIVISWDQEWQPIIKLVDQ